MKLGSSEDRSNINQDFRVYIRMLNKITLALVIVGGINWGLVGFFDYNLVEVVFGGVTKVVYDLVGLSALYVAFTSWNK